MDHAVALVQAYLQINGYFTVCEYPLVAEGRHGTHRAMTDLDVLAFRFPHAGRPIRSRGGRGADGNVAYEPDPALACVRGEADMIIGEVKEGHAELNEGARDPAVLCAALARFGCCSPEHAPATAEDLLRHGRARTHVGHQVRLVAFGSVVTDLHGILAISLGHVVGFLEDYLREHWEVLRHTQIKDDTLGLLAVIQKAGRGSNKETMR